MPLRYDKDLAEPKNSKSSDDLVQNFPEHQYPSIVGRPILRSEEKQGDIVVKDIMCGDEAATARSMLQISYPVRLEVPAFLHDRQKADRDLERGGRWKME